MTRQVLLFSLVSLAVYLGWLGYHYLSALGSAYGNAPAGLGPDHVGPVLVAVAALGVACIALAVFVPASAGRTLALVPVALVLLGQGYFHWSEQRNLDRHAQRTAARLEVVDAWLGGIPQDYVLQHDDAGRRPALRASFLTRDQDLGALVWVDVDHGGGVIALCIGRIHGGELETPEPMSARTAAFYRRFRNAAGEHLFDHFEVNPMPQESAAECDLRKYRI